MAGKSDRIYDELLCFLGDPIFQIPVRTFMDENCLIFDPTIRPSGEHEAVHERYKKLIDALLDSFCRDANISVDEAIKGITKLSQIPDLREVFHTLFEQVMAATDFNVFYQVMIKRNIMIQEQVLVMIISATGGLPQSLTAGKSPQREADNTAPATITTGADDKQEEALLRQIMDQAKKEETTPRQSKTEHDQLKSKKSKEEEEIKKTMKLSQQEAEVLTHERDQLNKQMHHMTISGSASRGSPGPLKATHPAPGPAPTASKLQQQVKLPPSLSGAKPVSGAAAANEWLSSAQAEAGTSATHSAMAASLSQLSPDELKKRQEFLRQQRDKLLVMKKDAREKQLGAAEKERPQRPQSARAARSAMKDKAEAAPQAPSPEDAKKMAMRRAIADRLRAEVIGKES